ncbi:MAG: head-tail adaptor protein [Paracoccaceae bacterium]
MKVVRLNRLLRLERPVTSPDGAGGFSIVWQDIGSIWAEIVPGTGRDAGGEEITLSSIPYRITVRGAPDGSARRPAAGERLRESGRVFRVLAVTEQDPTGHYLTCFVREEEPT